MEGNNPNKELLSNTLALNVALQTIKERCVFLQKRLYTLESENSRLRLSNNNNHEDKFNKMSKNNSLILELENLRIKNEELTLQKNQLTENLSMISTENKKLWKRLSQLTKESDEENKLDNENDTSGKHANVNLIRSKTFTQNSPHQLLKEKIAENHIGPIEVDDFEDILLINDYDFEASAKKIQNNSCLEFETWDVDSKSCAEGLFNIKKELLKQNSDLKVVLSNWRKLKSM